MGMVVRTNTMSTNAYRQLGANNTQLSKSLEKLSSGFRINRAGDDASGLAISEKMKAQIAGLNQASANSQDGISLVQTAEGALTEVHSMLNRMVELATKSANGTIQDNVDREAIQTEVDQLNGEITRIAQSTNFNGINLLDGSLDAGATVNVAVSGKVGGKVVTETDGTFDMSGTEFADGETVSIDGKTYTCDTTSTVDGKDGKTFKDLATLVEAAKTNGVTLGTTESAKATATKAGKELTLQVGTTSDTYNNVNVTVGDMSAKGLEINDLDVKTQATATESIQKINNAINTVSTNRGKLGALQNRLEHAISNLDTTAENMDSANSRIRDTDMAKEMMNYTKMNILSQAAQAMLAQANQQPQNILQLLK